MYTYFKLNYMYTFSLLSLILLSHILYFNRDNMFLFSENDQRIWFKYLLYIKRWVAKKVVEISLPSLQTLGNFNWFI